VVKSQEKNSKRRRFQFRLASLFVLITCLSFVFAFPRFALGWLALFAAVIGALILFYVFVYLPVAWLMWLFHPQRDDREADDSQIV
jgi:uncharacterized membrane protein YdjX (TVP38/TMEM64 family)